MKYMKVPEPLECLSTLLRSFVSQEPEWRLGDPPEHQEEEEVEDRGEAGDEPPVEDGSEAVGGQDPETHHQSEERQERAPPLDTAGDVDIKYLTHSVLYCTHLY